jgi:hypothetical protein
VQVRGEVPVQVPAVPNTPPCLTSPGVDCVRGQPDANGSVVASSDSDVTVGSGVEVEEVVVSEDDVRASLATTVRSNRSVVAALPFDPLHTFFTTEGHLFLLKPSMFKSPGYEPMVWFCTRLCACLRGWPLVALVLLAAFVFVPCISCDACAYVWVCDLCTCVAWRA